MQDGGPVHKLLAIRQILAKVFGNQVAALYNDVEWPPQSPDLNPYNFFLWGYLKSWVFAFPTLSANDLCARIELEFEELARTNLIRNSVLKNVDVM